MMWTASLTSSTSGSPNTPPAGPVVRNAEELRQLIAEKERQRAERSALTLNEEPPKPVSPE